MQTHATQNLYAKQNIFIDKNIMFKNEYSLEIGIFILFIWNSSSLMIDLQERLKWDPVLHPSTPHLSKKEAIYSK